MCKKGCKLGAACYWLKALTGYWPNPKGAPTPHISSQAQRIYRDWEMAQRDTGKGIKKMGCFMPLQKWLEKIKK